MERIVVPLDGSARSERAVPVAQAIARRTGAEVRLVEVVPIDELGDATRYLGERAALLRGVETGTEVLVTAPGRTVAESLDGVVREPGESMLCMTSHGRSGLGSAVLGSTAEDVLRRSGRPVLVVGRECALPWPGHRRTLLVPIDGSASGEQILGRIAEVVDRTGLQAVLVQVAHPFDVEEANHAGDALEHARRQLLAMGVDAKTEHRFASNVPLTIDEVARSWGAALIVMASYVRPGASRTLLGSITMSTIRHASCPVLVYPGSVLTAAAPG